MATLIHHYPTTVTNKFTDIVGGANLTAYTGCTTEHAVGQVKGMANRGFLPTKINGLAGGTLIADNALEATVTDAGSEGSLSFLLRMNSATGGTIIRFEGAGGRYLYIDTNGDLMFDAWAAWGIATSTELSFNTWRRITLVSTPANAVDVYLDNTLLRTTNPNLAMPAGGLRLFAFSGQSAPGAAELCDIRIYSTRLTTEEIAALVTADGDNPTSWSIYNPTGSDLGCGVIMGEKDLLAGGYTGTTYTDVAQVNGENKTRFRTNGESCRYAKCYTLNDKTEIYAAFKCTIPSTTIMNADHTAPGYYFNLFFVQSKIYTVDIPIYYICQVQAVWENPGDNKLKNYRCIWYDADNNAHTVNMPVADFPTDREVLCTFHIKYDGANSIIKVTIDGATVIDIGPGKSDTCDLTDVTAMKSVTIFPYSGVHLSMDGETYSFPIYLGMQYVGESEYIEITGSHKKRLSKAMRALVA